MISMLFEFLHSSIKACAIIENTVEFIFAYSNICSVSG